MAKRKSADEADFTDEEKEAAVEDAIAFANDAWNDCRHDVKKMFEAVILYVHGISLKHRNLRKQLEARVAELESKSVSWEGTWESGKVYARQSLVQDHGAVWIALRETAGRPPSGDWKLAVKSFDTAPRKSAK